MKTIWSYLKETFSEWNEDGASRLAAALAYYTVFSIAPLLVIAVAIPSLFFNQATVQQQLFNQIQNTIGPQGARSVLSFMNNANHVRTGLIASIVSIMILLVSASGLFTMLQTSLNLIWDVKSKPGRGLWATIRDRGLTFLMVLGIGFLLLASLIVSAVLTSLNRFFTSLLPGLSFLWPVAGAVISLGFITVLVALVYKYLPDVRIPWRSVWVGSLITALLFLIGNFLIGLYLSRASTTSTYGAAGSLVVILLWMYYSAQILFFGAEFTQVYARRHKHAIVSNENAEPIQAPSRSVSGVPRAVPDTASQRVFEPATAPTLNPVTAKAPPSVLTALGLMAAALAAWVFVVFRLVIPGTGPFRRVRRP